ncbi:MAG: hypothetical protein Q9187_006682 [Circinaria calcarea]
MSDQSSVSDPDGITGKLCNWAYNLELSQVPQAQQTRAKHIILDGLACGIVGAHLPWSETAAKAIFELEPSGTCSIIGWERKTSALTAALLNSTFIQGFELDDWHSKAPLHSASLILPALFAAIEHVRTTAPDSSPISGQSLLLATIVGFETGPRIGLGLGGVDMLSRGWHSGAVFGGPAAALGVSKLLALSPRQMEWALGTACTQAGGLMSAQFESMAKRMQHGFASRNGLTAALLSRASYSGIERVLERSYGGFLSTFTQGAKASPPYNADAVSAGLGERWEIDSIRIKPYAAMATLHAPIDCIRLLQEEQGELLKDVKRMKSVRIEMGEAAFKHGGWEVEKKPLEATGAQMNAMYAVAVQLVDGELLPSSYKPGMLERDILYDLIDKTNCVHREEFNGSFKTRIRIDFEGGEEAVATVEAPRGVSPEIANEEIVEKWMGLVGELIDEKRREQIQRTVLTMEECGHVELEQLIGNLGKAAACALD